MPKYIYRMPGSDDELQHFDISDIGKGLSAAGKAIGDYKCLIYDELTGGASRDGTFYGIS